MDKIVRYTGELEAFASGAQGLERTIFGDTDQFDDLDNNVNPDYLRGWGIVPLSTPPSRQDFNAVSYTISQLVSYLHQMGTAEWDDAQEYYIGSMVVRTGNLYISLIDDSINNDPVTDSVSWEKMARIGDGTPAGAVQYFAMQSAPTGWLHADGTDVSRVTYSRLFAAIGTTYGVGDGATTFGLPDFRGEFLRGFDDGRGVDTGRVFGSDQDDAMQEHSHYNGAAPQSGELDVIASMGYIDADIAGHGRHAVGSDSGNPKTGLTSGIVDTGDAVVAGLEGATTDAKTPSTAEVRPTNVALYACIKI